MSEYLKECQVPFSAGRNVPKISIPPNACDTHHHIYDPLNYPYVPEDIRNQPPSTVECYQLLEKRLGITRNVIIQPSAYGTDNRCVLESLKKMGKKNTRAIVVVEDSISDEELKNMDEAGVRGIRFNINCGGSDDVDVIASLAKKIAPLGWCICFWMSPDLVVSMEGFLRELPCQIVFDHRGHIPASEGIKHPAFEVICKMLKDEKAWVKLSGLYIDTGCEDYSDTIMVGKKYVECNPNRVLWGTDWPHPSCYSGLKPLPNDADLLDALFDQAITKENFQKILVDNPKRLFGFED